MQDANGGKGTVRRAAELISGSLSNTVFSLSNARKTPDYPVTGWTIGGFVGVKCDENPSHSADRREASCVHPDNPMTECDGLFTKICMETTEMHIIRYIHVYIRCIYTLYFHK